MGCLDVESSLSASQVDPPEAPLGWVTAMECLQLRGFPMNLQLRFRNESSAHDGYVICLFKIVCL